MPNKPIMHSFPFQPVKREQRPAAIERGYDRSWQHLRNAFIKANPTCFNCNDVAVCVDHVTPVAIDPSLRLRWDNLRSCCTECHNKLTANYRTTGKNELPKRSLAMGDWAGERPLVAGWQPTDHAIPPVVVPDISSAVSTPK